MLGLALVLALKWSEDLENGRLELIFSTPQSWTRILLERFGANVLVLLPAPALTWLAITIGAQLAHLSIDQGRVLAASFNMLPMALTSSSAKYDKGYLFRTPRVVGMGLAPIRLGKPDGGKPHPYSRITGITHGIGIIADAMHGWPSMFCTWDLTRRSM